MRNGQIWADEPEPNPSRLADAAFWAAERVPLPCPIQARLLVWAARRIGGVAFGMPGAGGETILPLRLFPQVWCQRR